MLRALFFIIKVSLLVAAGFWVASRPGFVEISWLGYDVRAHVGLAFLVLIFAGWVFALLLKILALPSWWQRWQQRKAQERGMKALARGMGAIAIDDARGATNWARKARLYLPRDRGLVTVLEGQAARLRGDEAAAQDAFTILLNDKDTLFLGLRGLLGGAVEKQQYGTALTYARQALALHRKQPWLLNTVYRLELRTHDFAAAEKTLKRARRADAVPLVQAKADRAAMAFYQAEQAALRGEERRAMLLWEKSWRIQPYFVPTALALAEAYRAAGKKRQAVALIEKTWKHSPHPQLAEAWQALAPKRKKADSTADLRWVERLVKLAPDAVESHMAAAQAALKDRLWGAARDHLTRAEALGPSAELYRLWAAYEEGQGQKDAALAWREKAATAPAGKVWVCRETGRLYERWAPIAQPHGAFNTIIWDVPFVGGRSAVSDPLFLPADDSLLLPDRVALLP